MRQPERRTCTCGGFRDWLWYDADKPFHNGYDTHHFDGQPCIIIGSVLDTMVQP